MKINMKLDALLAEIALGEDSSRQFKTDIRNGDSLASEMAAFANAEGGTMFIGVADDGAMPGLTAKDVARINQLISNAASQLVRSPLSVRTETIKVSKDRIVILLTVPKGLDKPYFDRKGVIWLKCGADKRRVNSKEELRRLFQFSDQFHADELPTRAGPDKLDKLRFRDFLRDVYQLDFPDDPDKLMILLQNLNLATDEGMLNLAGVLLFAERPEWIKPQFVIKAIRYPGNEIHASDYVDTEDFSGPFRKIFESSLAFVMRNLHKVQAGRGVNSPGLPEIPESVFEEILVNALVHRDYLVSAPIRLFIFDNRIEIISPGHLPNNLTIERIRAGISNIRNPILISFVAKGLLPYHGLGSGVKRALDAWPEIDFSDDREGCLFTVTVHRKETKSSPQLVEKTPILEIASGKTSEKMDIASEKTEVALGKTSEKMDITSEKTEVALGKTSEKMDIASEKTSGKILEAIRLNKEITISELSASIGVSERSIERNIQKLQHEKFLLRIGPDKGGHWELIEKSEG